MTTYTPITREQYRAKLEQCIDQDIYEQTVKLWGFTFSYEEDELMQEDPVLDWDCVDVYEPDVWEYLEYSSYSTTLQQHELEHLFQLREEGEGVTMSPDLLAILECNVRDIIADFLGMEVSL